MDKRFLIEDTADGSHTLFVPELNEHYHSVNGAIQESKHVFIDAGLHHLHKDNISILEIGFGTGLNTYLTLLDKVDSSSVIHYSGCELYPLPDDVIRKINYPQILEKNADLFYRLHQTEWGCEVEISPHFFLNKIHADFTHLDFLSDKDVFDLVYYDAFAPDKQSDVWSQDIFDYIYKHTSQDGVLVTYCAKGIVRRMLQQSGYSVERLQGPPGKREMLRAIKK